MSFGSRLSDIVDFVAGLAMIVTCAVVLWFVFATRQPGPEPLPKEPLSLEGVYLKGDAAAKVAIVEYGEVQCPACVSFERRTRPELMTRLVETGRVQFGFRHYPLPQHARAVPAAIAAYCAREHGKFWEMQSLLFESPARLEEDGLLAAAKEIGLDEQRWASCRASDAPAATLRRDIEQARLIKVRVTPTFFVGTILRDARLQVTARFDGAASLEVLENAVLEVEREVRRQD